MAKFVLKNAELKVNGVDLSDHASSVSVEDSADEVDFTSFGAGYKEFGQGLHDATITASFFQDFAAASVEPTIQPLYESGGTFSVVVKPVKGVATSGSNPTYTMTARIYSFNPISGAVGDASTFDATFRNAGTAGLVRGTT